jgi:hypothetical protein
MRLRSFVVFVLAVAALIGLQSVAQVIRRELAATIRDGRDEAYA